MLTPKHLIPDFSLMKIFIFSPSGILRRDSIWDKLVFKKVQQSLGGNVRFIVCGSAPLAPRILNFVRAATGAVVLEGYGQTECSAVCSLQLEGEWDAGD